MEYEQIQTDYLSLRFFIGQFELENGSNQGWENKDVTVECGCKEELMPEASEKSKPMSKTYRGTETAKARWQQAMEKRTQKMRLSHMNVHIPLQKLSQLQGS